MIPVSRPVPPVTEAPLLAPVRSAPVLGVPLALIDYERTLDWIDDAVAAWRRGYICVAAVHTVMATREDAELRSAVLGSDLTVPDGQPLVWALKLLGHPGKLAGPGAYLLAAVCAADRGDVLLPWQYAPQS